MTSLVNRTFGYRLSDGQPEPLFMVATVKPKPRGLTLPPGIAWARVHSELCPDGEEGTVPAAWLKAEFGPGTAPAMQFLFVDNPEAARRLAAHFPLFDLPEMVAEVDA